MTRKLREVLTPENVWGAIGERYENGAPGAEADAAARNQIRWGEKIPFSTDVGDGAAATALGRGRPCFFSEEKTIVQIPNLPERDWKLILGHEWDNPLEGLINVEGDFRNLAIETIFRIRVGLGSGTTHFLICPPLLSAMGGPPTGGDPTTLNSDAPAYVNAQYAPFEGSQSAVQLTNDPSTYSVVNLTAGRGAMAQSICMFDAPTAGFTVSAYVMVRPFTAEDALPENRIFHTRAFGGFAPYIRGTKT